MRIPRRSDDVCSKINDVVEHARHTRPTSITSSVSSLICVVLLAAMFGSRVHLLTNRNRNRIKKFSFIRVLVFLLYFVAIAFTTSAEVLEAGFNLSTAGSCKAAIYLCCVLYVGSKVLVQLFLVERVHVIKQRMRTRRQDQLWILSIAIVAVGFGAILIVALLDPIANFNDDGEVCRIGVPVTVTIPLIAYDILLNVALTAVFVGFLRPLLAFRERGSTFAGPPPVPRITSTFKHASAPSSSQVSIPVSHDSRTALTPPIIPPPVLARDNSNVEPLKKLVYKSLAGAVAMLIPTLINMGLLYKWRGEEQGWLCLTLCTIDETTMNRQVDSIGGNVASRQRSSLRYCKFPHPYFCEGSFYCVAASLHADYPQLQVYAYMLRHQWVGIYFQAEFDAEFYAIMWLAWAAPLPPVGCNGLPEHGILT